MIGVLKKGYDMEKVQSKFGGIWEKYSQGRTIIGEGTGTDSNGLVQTFTLYFFYCIIFCTHIYTSYRIYLIYYFTF